MHVGVSLAMGLQTTPTDRCVGLEIGPNISFFQVKVDQVRSSQSRKYKSRNGLSQTVNTEVIILLASYCVQVTRK